MDLETEYFFLINKQVQKRNKLIFDHFGKNFLEEYTKPEQRLWYKKVIAPIDKKIVDCANFVCGILLLNKNFTKIAEVFKDVDLNNWYNQKNIFYIRKIKKEQSNEINR